MEWILFLGWAAVAAIVFVGCIRAGLKTHAFHGILQVIWGTTMLALCAALWPLLATTCLILNVPRLISAVRS